MDNTKKGLIIIAVILATGFAGGHFLYPKKVVVKDFVPQTIICPANKVEVQEVPVVKEVVKQNTLVLTETGVGAVGKVAVQMFGKPQ